ncbi:MAG: hypothetical protein U0235_13435 [Polyangiaceae bacterium]
MEAKSRLDLLRRTKHARASRAERAARRHLEAERERAHHDLGAFVDPAATRWATATARARQGMTSGSLSSNGSVTGAACCAAASTTPRRSPDFAFSAFARGRSLSIGGAGSADAATRALEADEERDGAADAPGAGQLQPRPRAELDHQRLHVHAAVFVKRHRGRSGRPRIPALGARARQTDAQVGVGALDREALGRELTAARERYEERNRRRRKGGGGRGSRRRAADRPGGLLGTPRAHRLPPPARDRSSRAWRRRAPRRWSVAARIDLDVDVRDLHGHVGHALERDVHAGEVRREPAHAAVVDRHDESAASPLFNGARTQPMLSRRRR